MRIGLACAAAAALHGCGGGISGEVRDASSERPLERARVEVSSVGWGVRDGGLVKDKTTARAAATDKSGRFAFPDLSGGVALRAVATGFNPVDTPLCSRSPMVVRLGGPFDGRKLDNMLRLTAGAGWRFGANPAIVPLSDADLAVDRLPAGGAAEVIFRAPLGLAFTPGTGNPPMPPPLAQTESLTIDLLECGWLFVRTNEGGTAAIRVGSFGFDEPLQGERALMLSYGVLPGR